MASSDSELRKISTELSYVSLTKQQLLEKQKFQCIFQELKTRIEFGQTEEAAASRHDVYSIDDKLKQLTDKKTELQNTYENIVSVKDEEKQEREAKVSFSSHQKKVSDVPVCNIFCVEAPPHFPAPAVILDVENFPSRPCRTQCPECKQFIVTETYSSVSSVTWMVCCMAAMMGCVAGCCFIPFCVDKFKSITHRCPRCRTSIGTVKRL